METKSIGFIVAWIFIGASFGVDFYTSGNISSLAVVVAVIMLIVKQLQIEELKNKLNISE